MIVQRDTYIENFGVADTMHETLPRPLKYEKPIVAGFDCFD